MVGENVFVVIGKDTRFKKIQIDKIKSSILHKEPSLVSWNFSSPELSLEEIKSQIEALSFHRRLFIFRNSEKLSLKLKQYFQELIKNRKFRDYLIFDFDIGLEFREKLAGDGFFSFLFRNYPPYKIGKGFVKDFSLKDLYQALKKGLTSQALFIIYSLFKKERSQRISLQILGVIIRAFIEQAPSHLKSRNLKYVFDTERTIKEGKVSPQLALELLILRLTLKKF